MRVLLTNDDGIDAPGILALEAALDEEFEVTVVAPHRSYSGCGHQVTYDQPLRVEELAPGRFKVFGTPADCVRLGVVELAPHVDWVLCGINAGANLGVDLVMSGTVAAAREATWLGKPSIALSQYMRRDVPRDWDRTQQLARLVLRELWTRSLATDRFWNVNLPDDVRLAEQVPMKDTFPEPQHLDVTFRVVDNTFEYRGDYRKRPRTPGSDVDSCFGGAVSISSVSALS